MPCSNEQRLQLLRRMRELRAVDDRIVPLKLKDLVMNGFHPYVGQEAVAVGICSALRPDDYVVSTHRPQGHALAKGASMESVFAEMLGRMGGPSNGLGGPMQWVDAETRFFCGSIVGSGISYATGFALAAQRERQGRVVVCFFGDGASNTGSFHEGLNLASIWQLPVLYVCENNQYGEAMPVSQFVSATPISKRAQAYSIPGRTIDGMNVETVAETAREMIEHLRTGSGPRFLETSTYRYRGHYLGDPDNYRTKDEIAQWRDRDPVESLRRTLIESGDVTASDLDRMDEDVESRAERAEAWALEQPSPTLEFATSHVLAPLAGRDS